MRFVFLHNFLYSHPAQFLYLKHIFYINHTNSIYNIQINISTTKVIWTLSRFQHKWECSTSIISYNIYRTIKLLSTKRVNTLSVHTDKLGWCSYKICWSCSTNKIKRFLFFAINSCNNKTYSYKEQDSWEEISNQLIS